jgi:arsenate reductase (thioredoxin)
MTVPEVLFVCVHNAGRSQMAAGLMAHRAEGKVRVRSAGSDPAEEINPAVVEVMAALGIDLSAEFPKPLSDDAVRTAKRGRDHGLWRRLPGLSREALLRLGAEDPAGKDLEAVRRIRDEIDARVRALLEELSRERR